MLKNAFESLQCPTAQVGSIKIERKRGRRGAGTNDRSPWKHNLTFEVENVEISFSKIYRSIADKELYLYFVLEKT